jgi:hypothetical protein
MTVDGGAGSGWPVEVAEVLSALATVTECTWSSDLLEEANVVFDELEELEEELEELGDAAARRSAWEAALVKLSLFLMLRDFVKSPSFKKDQESHRMVERMMGTFAPTPDPMAVFQGVAVELRRLMDRTGQPFEPIFALAQQALLEFLGTPMASVAADPGGGGGGSGGGAAAAAVVTAGAGPAPAALATAAAAAAPVAAAVPSLEPLKRAASDALREMCLPAVPCRQCE